MAFSYFKNLRRFSGSAGEKKDFPQITQIDAESRWKLL